MLDSICVRDDLRQLAVEVLERTTLDGEIEDSSAKSTRSPDGHVEPWCPSSNITGLRKPAQVRGQAVWCLQRDVGEGPWITQKFHNVGNEVTLSLRWSDADEVPVHVDYVFSRGAVSNASEACFRGRNLVLKTRFEMFTPQVSVVWSEPKWVTLMATLGLTWASAGSTWFNTCSGVVLCS